MGRFLRKRRDDDNLKGYIVTPIDAHPALSEKVPHLSFHGGFPRRGRFTVHNDSRHPARFMNPLRRLVALPLALILLWALVIAPAAYARCEHDDGSTRMHALGAVCSDDDDDDGENRACPDNREISGAKTGSAGGPPACSLFKGDDAAQPDNAQPLKTPPPADFIPVYPAFLATPLLSGEPILPPVANAPPDSPPRRTHGRGALPLLS